MSSPNRAVTLTNQAALIDPSGMPGALVMVIDPVESLTATTTGAWAASPVVQMEALLRECKVAIGLVMDGWWWALVSARPSTMAASGVVDALTWIEEDRVRDAFFALLARSRIVGGDPAQRLPVLFEQSVAAAEEVTEALGAQVREPSNS